MLSELFAIFGNPVSHSKSPLMHNFAFHALKYNGCYSRYLLENGKHLRDTFISLGLSGANITVPHKEAAFEACDWCDEFAKKVKAVNTIVLKDGKLHGYNTDGPGFLKAIDEFNNIKTILILGAGGTAGATSMILRDAGYQVSILNRTSERLKQFIQSGFKCYDYESLPTDASFDLIANMTSAGLQDHNLPAPISILEPLINNANGCIDIIYGKETPFLKLAKKANKPTQDGSAMLLNQGVLAFDHFTNHKFKLDQIEQAMKIAFL
ncbi:MAG: shikimate dehydrogenase [Sulfurovaceae bacterium]|nr:shikimate dehydrogenase [Sulfurovaceae bacterium]